MFRIFCIFRIFCLFLQERNEKMEVIDTIKIPSKSERKVARNSYNALILAVDQLKTEQAEIEIEETKDRIVIPVSALKLLGKILKTMGEGKPIAIVPQATEVTTQSAAEILGCSRPHLVKLLEKGEIEYTKVGKHRRIKFEDVVKYKQQMKEEQKKHLIDIMNLDDEIGLYDS